MLAHETVQASHSTRAALDSLAVFSTRLTQSATSYVYPAAPSLPGTYFATFISPWANQ